MISTYTVLSPVRRLVLRVAAGRADPRPAADPLLPRVRAILAEIPPGAQQQELARICALAESGRAHPIPALLHGVSCSRLRDLERETARGSDEQILAVILRCYLHGHLHGVRWLLAGLERQRAVRAIA